MKNKLIALLLASIITITYGNFAEAAEVIKETDINSANSKVNENNIDENIYTKDNRNYIENNYNSNDLDIESSLEFDQNTDKITVDASLNDEYGNNLDKTYDVTFLRIVNENDFKAEFTDQDTGEKLVYDTNEVKASVAPVVAVLVGFIAKQGLKMAIKKYGKTVVTSMIRTSPQVAAQAAKNLGYSATKSVSHGKKVFKKNGKGNPKYISVDKDGHNGGAWKGASSIKDLGSKKTRSGTYDANLKRIGD
ncbi:SAR2788 family putative toxin [Mammaliicoccus sciuri]|uniref:SAR2788 family putative toxin n=1 Tax=Mammaliicoccus sciuri TaxID=1296 RepID=UPI000D1F144B|nr:SAR2788 family putative toxin [Mammaliicoccus sciuri]PTK23888.1 hypothetical protein BUZ86_12615 [Mammaliicoccus sciuri]